MKDKKIIKKSKIFINGEFIRPTKLKYFDLLASADNSLIGRISKSSKEDLDKALKVAKGSALRKWSKKDPQERGEYLFKISSLIEDNLSELSTLETIGEGKALKEALEFSLPKARDSFFYYAGWSDKLCYLSKNNTDLQKRVFLFKGEDLYSIFDAAKKIAPVLALGNTIVFISSKKGSLALVRLAELIKESGLPDGVVNILTSDEDILDSSIGLKKVKVIPPRREENKLGAQVIFKDAPLNEAVEGVIDGAFLKRGIGGNSSPYLFVEESLKDIVCKKIKKRMKKIRVGDPLDLNSELGASLEDDFFKSWSRDMEKKGHHFFEASVDGAKEEGFQRPIFFENETLAGPVFNTFKGGPCLILVTFRTPNELKEMLGHSTLFNSITLWSEKSSRVQHLPGPLEIEKIWINTFGHYPPGSSQELSFYMGDHHE